MCLAGVSHMCVFNVLNYMASFLAIINLHTVYFDLLNRLLAMSPYINHIIFWLSLIYIQCTLIY